MIFFDYDGVLVDSLWLWEESCKNAAINMGFNGDFPVSPYANLNPVAHKEIGKNLGLDPLEFESNADRYFLSRANELKLFNGTKEMLEILVKDFNLCILSSSNEKIVKETLDRFNILSFFDAFYCGSKITKGDRLKKHKTNKSIMIGDAISDIEAAKTAGVYSIGVLWGWQSMNMLHRADSLANNHVELIEAIRSFYENNTSH